MAFGPDKKRVITSLALTVLFNTIIALFLTHLEFGGGFLINFVFSQSIGLCICGAILLGHKFVRSPSILGHAVLLLVAIPVGATIGIFAGGKIAGFSFSSILKGDPALFAQMIFIGALFGTIITYFFFSREKILQTEAQLRQAQIRGLTLEKKTLESHLRLLQAQIEPHFLFNTLSNILSLLDADPESGKAMLENLTQYLRSSLSRSRARMTTLGEEMNLISAYLAIHGVRMGERLRYTLEIPENLLSVPLPPMLIQPLVENALTHGIEPRIKGGSILVRAEENGRGYRLMVSDTGSGFSESMTEGIGLSNVRERLKGLYQDRARLILQENQPTGLKAILEFPHE